MKKFISVLLSLIISISIIPFSERSAFAQNEELVDIDIFKAQCMAGIAEDNHSDAVDQCVNLYNYYVNDNIYSPTQTFLDSLYANDSLMALYETWQIYNLEKTPSAALQQMASKEDYYESLIIGMYQKALVQQSDLKELINNKILNDSRDMVSTLCEITSAADAAELSGMMALSDPETYTKVTETVESEYSSGIASKIVGNISLVFEAAENVVDALDRISMYASMAELDESAKLWLQQLYEACDSNVPAELKNAVSNLKDASMGFADAALVSVKENTFSLSLWAFDSVINAGIQSAAALNPVTNAVMIGLTAGKTICNILFGSDDIYEQLYLMECIYEIQDLSRRVAENCKNTFVNNQTKENALAFNYAVDCYYESIINIDIDCMKSFLDKLYNGGIDLGSAGGVLDLVISWVYGTPDDYDDAVDSLESLRNTRITNKQNLEAYVWIALEANHPETYDYYFPDKDMVPVTSLSFLVTYILPPEYEHETNKTKIVEGDDATYWVDYSPEEADLTDYTITVSDPEILQIKDGVILALKPGTATVTVTSTADDHVFDTAEIKVIERIGGSEEDDEFESSKFTYTISNNEVTITGLAEGYEPTELVIPSTIEGYPVVTIGSEAFAGCDCLTEITIPDSVTSIGEYAFEDCKNLTSITIPDSVTSIGEGAFYNTGYYNNSSNWEYNSNWKHVLYIDKCLIIASDKFDKINSYEIKNGTICIAEDAFSDCNILTEIIIPDSVTSIGASAFEGCNNLTNVTLGNGVTSIGDRAFYGCDSLTEIMIPDSVTSIGEYTFYNCDSLTNLTLGNGVTSIGDRAFYGCDSLTEIMIPDSVTSIGASAFEGCNNLTNVTLGNGVTSIGDRAFYGCDSLTEIMIPDSVTSIGEYAFYNCDSLTNLTLGNGVTSIGSFAFWGCGNLEKVNTGNGISDLSSFDFNKNLKSIVLGNSITTIGPTQFNDCTDLECVITGDGISNLSAFDFNENLKSIAIGNSITSIEDNTFSECCGLTNVIIGNSVIKIGKYAFSKCTNLKDIVIPESVTSIDDYAFEECINLMGVVLDSVTSIGEYAFCKCINLKNVTISQNAKSIGYGAFSGCSSLEEMTLPNVQLGGIFGSTSYVGGVATVQHPSQSNISGIYTYYIPLSLKTVTIIDDEICSYAFENCSSIENISLEGVTNIGKYAFKNCTNLSNIIVEDTVCSIGVDAFADTAYSLDDNNWENGILYLNKCLIKAKESVTEVEILNDTFCIADYAFSGCCLLKNITIPNSISHIGNYVFANCSSLMQVKIPDSVITLGYTPFINCEKLEVVNIGNGISDISSGLFDNCRQLKEVVFGSGISSGLNRDIFSDSDNNLESIEVSEENQKYSSLDGVLFNKNLTTLIMYPNKRSGEEYIVPSTVTKIDNDAFNFYGYSGVLSRISLPEGLISLGDYAFYCCRIEDFILPKSLQNIGKKAFSSCDSYYFNSIDIPENVNVIGEGAFSGCDRLTEINVSEANTTYCSEDGVLFNKDKSILLQYPAGNINKIYFIPETVKEIADESFDGNRYLKSIVVTSSLEKIGWNNFGNNADYRGHKIENVLYTLSASEWSNIVINPNNDNLLSANYHFDFELINSENVPSTCQQAGYFKYTCSCGYTISDSYDLVDCNYQVFRVVAPTCLNDGYTVYKCSICGTEYEGDWIYAEGHQKSEVIETIPATCTEDGYTVYKCSVCGEEYQDDWVYSEGHQKGEIIETVAVTCTNDGYTLYKCSVCGEEYEDDWVYCEGHQKGEAIRTVEPTCTEDGFTVYKCSVCGEEYEDDWVYCEGHQKGNVIETVPASCTCDGYTLYKCSVCGEEFEADWTWVDHSYEIKVSEKSATCSERGYIEYKCATCDDTYIEYTEDALGHVFENNICTRCGMLQEDCIESEHPYADDMDKTYTLYKKSAQSIAVTFSSDTYVEEGYDYIYIYDTNDNLIGTFTGDELSSKKIVVAGDTVKIRITSDSSYTDYGFAIAKVETDVKQEFTDDNTGITVSEEILGALPSNTILVIDELSSASDSVTYEITLQKDGEEIQPNGTVTVKIPVPDGMDGNTCKVYRQEADGSDTDMNAVYQDGYMVFTTDHFSRYILTTGDPSDSEVRFGDINGDGTVNMRDCTILQQYLNEWDVEVNLSDCDVNRDNAVNMKDLSLLQQYLNGWEVDLA